MIDESSFLIEFLAETNLMLTQIDYNNKLYDLITPIKNFLLKEKELLSFSMARYCGANAQIAFFCEWYYQTLKLTTDMNPLAMENRNYFQKKVPLKFRGVPNIFELVEQDIALFVPQQLSLLQTKSKSILDSQVAKNPYLNKYLNDQFLSQVLASVYSSNKRKYCESVSLSEYIESQATSTSFVQIAFPCLVGFCYSFNQSGSPVNPNNIKWVVLEEILKNISLLHQINQNHRFDEFVYSTTLSEKEEFEWMQLDEKNRFQRLLANSEVREIIRSHKVRIYKSALKSLENISLPPKNQEMLRELLEWSKMIPIS